MKLRLSRGCNSESYDRQCQNLDDLNSKPKLNLYLDELIETSFSIGENMQTKATNSTFGSLNGVFDHQLVTLPQEDFIAVRNFFNSELSLRAGALRWRDDHDVKGFLHFEDGSYLEIWNQSKFSKYGYQDACRVESEEDIIRIAEHYKVESGKFPALVVAGRTGWTGDPTGGMFFIWQPGRKTDSQKFGIRQILSAVVPSPQNQISEEMYADYQLAGMKIEFRVDKSVMIVSDLGGVTRILVATPDLNGNGLVALRFSRSGVETDTLNIKKNNEGHAQIFLKLEAGTGTLIFRADLFKSTSKFLINPES